METVAIGTTGRRATRLGFGCSSVMGVLGRGPSLRLLETAYEAGIRHFDVAPLYGYGQAEACLGEFLKDHPEVTVTTKYGIEPPKNRSLIGLARSLVRPVLKLLPGAKRKLAQVASHVAPKSARSSFTVAGAQASLERSLTALQRDYIDLWLLHEVEADDLEGAEGDALLGFLEDAASRGKIGRFGIASGQEKIPALVAAHPAFCRARQYEWSVLDPVPEPSSELRLHHRALTDRFRSLQEALSGRPATADRWSAEVGVDVVDADVLAELMLKAALVKNPGSIILFSSKNPQHIAENARLADDRDLDLAAAKFYELVQASGILQSTRPQTATAQPETGGH